MPPSKLKLPPDASDEEQDCMDAGLKLLEESDSGKAADKPPPPETPAAKSPDDVTQAHSVVEPEKSTSRKRPADEADAHPAAAVKAVKRECERQRFGLGQYQ